MMYHVAKIATTEQFLQIFNNLDDHQRHDLCLEILETIPSVDLKQAKKLCIYLNHLTMIVNRIVTDETGMLNIFTAAFEIILEHQDVNTVRTLLNNGINYDIVALAYSRLKESNIKCIDPKMNIFIESYQISSKFFVCENLESQKLVANKGYAKKVADRLTYLIKLTKFVIDMENDLEINQLFLFNLKQVVINISMMKNTIPKTQKVIPWSELEFYCIQFIQYYTRDSVMNLLSFGIITKYKLMNYLKSFHSLLENEANRIKQNQTGKNQKKGKNCSRNDQANVKEQSKESKLEFKQLIQDYNFLRDLHSMYRIQKVINLTDLVDPNKKYGQIVIIRALQVLGEHTKSTAQTPKMSQILAQRLLKLLPPGILDIVQRLRDGVSHSANIRQAISSSDFPRMQYNLRFIGDAIRYTLIDYKHQLLFRIAESTLASVDNISVLKTHFQRNRLALFKFIRANNDVTSNSFMLYYHNLFDGDSNNQTSNSTNMYHNFLSYEKNFTTGQLVEIAVCSRMDSEIICDHLRSMSRDILNIPRVDMWDNFVESFNIWCDRTNDLSKRFNLKTISTSSLRQLVEDLKTVVSNFSCEQYRSDRVLRTAVEQILLEIFSQLEEEHLLTDARQWIDAPIPLLSGKPLRNHLAHYNAVIEILPIDQNIAIYQNACSFVSMLNDTTPDAFSQKICLEPRYDIADIEKRSDELSKYIASLSRDNLNTDAKFTSHELCGFPVNAKNDFGETRLHIAAAKGDVDMIQLLIRHGADGNLYDYCGFTPLHVAVCAGFCKIVKVMLQYQVHVDASRTKDNRTCLHLASMSDLEMSRMLIALGANVNAKSTTKRGTVLRIASRSGTEEIIQLLFDSGVNHDPLELELCLLSAIESGLTSNVAILIRYGANVRDKPLIIEAIANNNETSALEIIQLLLQHGANINMTDKQNKTALYHAVHRNHLQISLKFLQNGAEIGTLINPGLIPLRLAWKYQNIASLEELFTQILDNKAWKQIIKIALETRSVENVKYLLEQLPKDCLEEMNDVFMFGIGREDSYAKFRLLLNLRSPQNIEECINQCIILNDGPVLKCILDNYCQDVIDIDELIVDYCAEAITCNSQEVVKVLLTYMNPTQINKTPLKKAPNGHITPMYIAAYFGDTHTIRSMLAKGAQSCDNTLRCAIEGGHDLLVDILWKNNPPEHKIQFDIFKVAIQTGNVSLTKKILGSHIKQEFYFDVLQFAACNGILDIIKFLHRQLREINLDCVLHLLYTAVSKGHVHVVGYLLSSKHTKGLYPDNLYLLHYATAFEQMPVLEYLLKLGYDINRQDDVGNTCLHIACSSNNLQIVDLLLRNGAIYNLPDHQEVVPVQLATSPSIKHMFLEVDGLFKAVREKDKNYITDYNSARLNVANSTDGMAIHLASKLGYYEMILVLLQRGAQYNPLSQNGVSPESLATDERINSILQDLSNLFNISMDLLSHNLLELSKTYTSEEFKSICYATDNNRHTIIQKAIINNHLEVPVLISLCFNHIKEDCTIESVRRMLKWYNPTHGILFADILCRQYIKNKEYDLACDLLYILNWRCQAFSTNYFINLTILIAQCKTELKEFEEAKCMIEGLYSIIKDSTTFIKLYKVCVCLYEQISLDCYAILCEKICHKIMCDFNWSQKQMIYECIYYKNTSIKKGRILVLVEKFFNDHPSLDLEIFKLCIRFTLLPNSTMKKSTRFLKYLQDNFAFVDVYMQVKKSITEGKIIAARNLINEWNINITAHHKNILGKFDECVIQNMEEVAILKGFETEHIKQEFHYLLHKAAKEGNLDFLLICLNSGADPNERDAENFRPIDYAFNNEHSSIVDVLLRQTTFNIIDILLYYVKTYTKL